MNGVFQNLHKEFMDKIKRSETVISDLKENFDLKIESIRESIQIRVESLKMELEKLEKKLNDELDQHKMNWKIIFERNGGREINKDEYYKDLEDIERSIKDNKDLNEANLYKFQNKIKNLNDYIESCRELALNISFIESEEELNGDLIGEIAISDIIQRIKSNKCKTISIGPYKPFDICLLPNGNTLICGAANSNISLLDTKNELKKSINTINNQSLGVVSACTNDVDAVYLSNHSYHTIIKTDLNLNTQLASFGYYGQVGTDNDHLKNPDGICFSNNSVYVCDIGNKRIQKLNADLVYKQSFKLNYSPWYIKILNDVACVRTMNTKTIICFMI